MTVPKQTHSRPLQSMFICSRRRLLGENITGKRRRGEYSQDDKRVEGVKETEEKRKPRGYGILIFFEELNGMTGIEAFLTRRNKDGKKEKIE